MEQLRSVGYARIAAIAGLLVIVVIVASVTLGDDGADTTGARAATPAASPTASDPGDPQLEAGPLTDPEGWLDGPPPMLGEAGELVDLVGWLQSDIDARSDLDGRVHVVHMWTFGCYNCKNTMPHMRELYARWGPGSGSVDADGRPSVEVIGVHAPEFDYEKDVDAIVAAAAEQGVTWPIALDTDKKNFRSWQGDRRFWPRTYVIDQSGEIRFDRIGEGAYDDMDATVAYLLANPAA